MGLFDRFFNRFKNKTEDELADRAFNKVFGKKEQKEEVKQEAPAEKQPVATPESTQTVNVNAEMPSAEQMLAMNELMKTSMAASNQAMAQSNETLKYMIFDDDMNWVGVKDDAPEALKLAYKQHLKEQKEGK